MTEKIRSKIDELKFQIDEEFKKLHSKDAPVIPDVRTYLGDGLYAHDDGFQIELTTRGSIGPTQCVFLDDHVLLSFFEFIARKRKLQISISDEKGGNTRLFSCEQSSKI